MPDESDPKFLVDSLGNTTITDGTFSAPIIRGNKVEVVIPKTSGDADTGFILVGTVGGDLHYQYLRIYADNVNNQTVFASPSGTRAFWMFPTTEFAKRVVFSGEVEFSGPVTGLHLTLA